METVNNDLMTPERAKIELDALGLNYNIIGYRMNRPVALKSCMIMEHNFNSIATMYNTGRRFTFAIEWQNGTSKTIAELAAMYVKFNIPADAKLYMQFDRYHNDEEEYDDKTEFEWFRPYSNFREFYECNKDSFASLINIVKKDHQIYYDFKEKLERNDAK
jgi:hypothetical protein